MWIIFQTTLLWYYFLTLSHCVVCCQELSQSDPMFPSKHISTNEVRMSSLVPVFDTVQHIFFESVFSGILCTCVNKPPYPSSLLPSVANCLKITDNVIVEGGFSWLFCGLLCFRQWPAIDSCSAKLKSFLVPLRLSMKILHNSKNHLRKSIYQAKARVAA